VFNSAGAWRKSFWAQGMVTSYTRIMKSHYGLFSKSELPALKGSGFAVATSSGQAAQFLALNKHLRKLVIILISTTYLLWRKLITNLKLLEGTRHWSARFAKAVTKADAFEALMMIVPTIYYLKTIGNPEFNVSCIWSDRCGAPKSDDIPLVVDNTFGCGLVIYLKPLHMEQTL